MTGILETGFFGAAWKLTPFDIASAAESLGCDAAALRAVLAVEASGSGFDKQSRPKMLFERHVFHRALARHAPGKVKAAVDAGLAVPRWIPGRYPPDSYPRLTRAAAIDLDCALMAASWGIGQVMGENWRIAGADNVQAMVLGAMDSEGAQLAHMAAFIDAKHLGRALRAKDWVAFAVGYNGASQAAHGYDKKLAAAYDREMNRT